MDDLEPIEPRPQAPGSPPDAGSTTRRAPRAMVSASTGASACFRPHRVVGSYRLGRQLGQGGFADVFEAEHVPTGRRVALKVFTGHRDPSAEAQARFEQEGRLAASLSHPHCVYAFAAERLGDHLVLAMELMPGGTLQDLLDREGPLPIPRAVDLALDVLAGLEAAHRMGILHRDLKPSNCFLDSDGHARIGDFGISKALAADAGLTSTGAFLGTPAYASPEQVRGREVDHRSDYYSLGATLFALLTGGPPFRASGGGDMLAAIVADAPQSLRGLRPEVSPGLERVVLRLLAKDPTERPATAGEVREDLRPHSSERLPAAQPWRRAVAQVIDRSILAMPSFVVLLALVDGARTGALMDRLQAVNRALAEMGPGGAGAFAVGELVLSLTYFTLFEGVWSRTPGKRLLGIRVVAGGARRVTLRQAFVRSGVYFLPSALALRVVGLLPLSGPAMVLVSAGIWWGWVALRCLPMRRSNGWACLHDIASGTSVRHAVPLRSRARTSEAAGTALAATAGPRPLGARGPYEIVDRVWESERATLSLGTDSQLGRRVWILEGVRPQAAEGGRQSRTRLRWLQGGEHEGRTWDAFEAPEGNGLRELVTREGPLDWATTRDILLALGEELAARADSPPNGADSDAVFVDAFGAPRLLDFPLRRPAVVGGVATQGRLPAWQALLRDVAALSLLGPGATGSDPRPSIPLPLHAARILDILWDDAAGLEGLEGLLGALRAARNRPTEVTRAQRLMMHAAPAGLALLAALLGLLMGLGGVEEGVTAAGFVLGFTGLLVQAPAMLVAPVLAFTLRGGPLLAWNGVAVIDESGRVAGRWHCAARAWLAWWAPVLVAFVCARAIRLLDEDRGPFLWTFGIAGLACHVGGVVVTLVTPERGVVDRALGTWLVRT